MKVKSIRKSTIEPVYNMTVSKHHNYLIKGDIILKNCDAVRYFCMSRTQPGKLPEPAKVYDDFEREEYEVTGGEISGSYINC